MSSEWPSSIQLSLLQLKTMSEQALDELIVLLILRGHVHIQVTGQTYQLTGDDVIVIHPYEIFALQSDNETLILKLMISRVGVEQYLKRPWTPRFACNSAIANEGEQDTYRMLRETLTYLMLAYYRQHEGFPFEMGKYMFKLLSILTTHFQGEQVETALQVDGLQNERIRSILHVIDQEFRSPLSLEQFAHQEYISLYHLSRLFKKTVGMTFTQYVNEVRLKKAVPELIHTELPILKIAMNNGFANVKTFNRCFKERYGMTPSEFRSERRPGVLAQESVQAAQASYEVIDPSAALDELSKYMVKKDLNDHTNEIREKLELLAEAEHSTVLAKPRKIMNIGQASELMDQEVRSQLQCVHQELQFHYIRMIGFGTEHELKEKSNMLIERPNNNRIFDFIVQNRMMPMIQFKVDDVLASHSGRTKEGSILDMVRYLMNRYGRSELETWCFELVPGPVKDSKAIQAAYESLYDQLKEHHPRFQVGIQILSSLDQEETERFRSFVDYAKMSQREPDFVTLTADPSEEEDTRDGEDLVEYYRKYQQNLVQHMKQGFEQAGLDQPRCFITEWNTLVGQGDVLSGSFFRAALIIETLADLASDIQGLGFWLNIKLKEKLTGVRQDSCLSVFLYEKLKRPLFFVLQMFDRLGSEMLHIEEGCIFTREGEERQLLVYNACYMDPLYSIDDFLTRVRNKRLEIDLSGLPARSYQLKQYLLDKDHGGIYHEWLRLGAPRELDAEMLRYLERKILPEVRTDRRFLPDGLNLHASLTMNACKLYVIQPLL
ncbi:helix-turn-helix domain-containing protein [Paenibacillus thiaminolyticus]|uniref:Helix-turn-helix domain-containing protein n=1 Tax=Paenibacillus thiaminolyticus TaxID=49283 RepID=A0A3A3GMJ1_PANTH|nr:helix-turn-helix domain-containing protein [Paenibacillus thiaminolyticus]RJG23988.1 helix-turn-helix domain-containing protein [Paenibacillus thiaminolyticus]